MAALETGTAAPKFTLQTWDGRSFDLQEALSHGPVLLAFFKISCPVCQFAFPYLERLYQSYRGKSSATVVGVSQNSKSETAAFLQQYGVTFPVLLDDTRSYPVSNAYGLTNVPTLFWIESDGEITLSSVGWVRKDIEQLNRLLAESGKLTPASLFSPGENIPDYRPG
jgi:peroxiredoxin